MAGDKMPRFVFLIDGRDVLAYLHRLGATGMEFTAQRRVCRRGNIPFENDALALFVRVGIGHGGKQCVGIRVHGMIEDFILIAEFDHRTQIHDADTVGNVFHDRQIVRHKQIRQLSFLL